VHHKRAVGQLALMMMCGVVWNRGFCGVGL
jgi:hypothetical protein